MIQSTLAALAEDLHEIPVILAVAAVFFLAISVDIFYKPFKANVLSN
jgi:hypothetical protein